MAKIEVEERNWIERGWIIHFQEEQIAFLLLRIEDPKIKEDFKIFCEGQGEALEIRRKKWGFE
jgi:uncharacterized protein YecA (UPF0149 family)